MEVLGIETSCDESAAAVVEDGRKVLSSVVFSQVPLQMTRAEEISAVPFPRSRTSPRRSRHF